MAGIMNRCKISGMISKPKYYRLNAARLCIRLDSIVTVLNMLHTPTSFAWDRHHSWQLENESTTYYTFLAKNRGARCMVVKMLVANAKDVNISQRVDNISILTKAFDAFLLPARQHTQRYDTYLICQWNEKKKKELERKKNISAPRSDSRVSIKLAQAKNKYCFKFWLCFNWSRIRTFLVQWLLCRVA